MPKLDHSWHESVLNERALPGSSDRSFGLVFAAVSGLLALIALWRGRDSALWWIIIAFVFLVLACAAPTLLGPLNRAWRRVSLQISICINPLIMALIFFGVLTPIGLLVRLLGKDPLRLSFEADRLSYWIDRSSQSTQPTSMTRQF